MSNKESITNTHVGFVRSLDGPWLIIARTVWLALTGLVLFMFAAGLAIHFAQMRTIINDSTGTYEQLLPADSLALQQLGISIDTYAGYMAASEILFFAPFLISGAIIFWRKPSERITLLISLLLITYGATQPSATSALFMVYYGWQPISESIEAFSNAGLLIILYLFPDGRFVPSWTRILTTVWLVLTVLWLLFPEMPGNHVYGRQFHAHPARTVLIVLSWFSTGIYAQVYRYLHVSTPIQRQQTKWIVLGFIGMLFAGATYFLPRAIYPSLSTPGFSRVLGILVITSISTLMALLLPISFSVAVLRYRLWDIDAITNRVLVYGFLTGFVTFAYFGGVALFQAIFSSTGTPWIQQASGLLLVLYSITVALLLLPLRQRVQKFVDRRFYREKVDFQRAFTDFAHELRLIIELPDLLRALVESITGLLHSASGVVFMGNADGIFVSAATSEPLPNLVGPLRLDESTVVQLQAGQAIVSPSEQPFPLLLPLITPRASGTNLVGVLALGPRLSEQPYTYNDLTLLLNLAEQAGTAIAVAQSIQVERQLEAQRNSPIGRAEILARDLLVHPETALHQLHHLAHAAGQEPNAAGTLANLPQAFTHIAHLVGGMVAEDDLRALRGLADGYHDLLRSQVTPEILVIGLRTIIIQLEQLPANAWQESTAALSIFRQCQTALAVENIAQVEALSTAWSSEQQMAGTAFERLARTLSRLRPVVDAVHAYERVTLAEDKLAYLIRAIECLGQLQPEPSILERVILQGITARWSALFTAALRALSLEAQLDLTLITRQVIAADQVMLAFKVTNSGHGSATNIKVELLSNEEFEIIEGKTGLDALLPNQSMQMSFVIHPVTHGVLQPSLRIQYDDQDRAEKGLIVTASVHPIAVPATFRPIPNFYAPGTPLRSNSPVFFGREDLLTFIDDTVQRRAGGRVLVLIGERRMGKTSLAQQLPMRLQRDCVTVYLDCQSLVIDPGIESFLYDVALEIADTVNLPIPDLTDFATRPVAFFGREFLPRALAAAGDRRLLLLFDEFEELETRVVNGKLPAETFSFLRHLMQHEERLGFIFVGTHRLADLNPVYWSAFFNVALHRQVGHLTEEAAKTVITQPVAAYLFYDDLALDKIWRLTAGHPYFLQLLCHTLVSEANRVQRNYVLVAQLNAAAEQALELGEAHFVFLWEQLRPSEQKLLQSIATQTNRGFLLTPAMLASHLTLSEESVFDTISTLVAREIVRPVGGPIPGYEFVLDVLRLWIQRRHSL